MLESKLSRTWVLSGKDTEVLPFGAVFTELFFIMWLGSGSKYSNKKLLFNLTPTKNDTIMQRNASFSTTKMLIRIWYIVYDDLQLLFSWWFDLPSNETTQEFCDVDGSGWVNGLVFGKIFGLKAMFWWQNRGFLFSLAPTRGVGQNYAKGILIHRVLDLDISAHWHLLLKNLRHIESHVRGFVRRFDL